MSERDDLARAIAGLDAKKRELLALLARQGGLDLSRMPILPVPREAGAFPLSFAQERLWFLDQMRPGDPVYNIPLAVWASGAFDVRLLALVMSEIARRHETLRTRFTAAAAGPVQVVVPPSPVPVPVVDLGMLPDGAMVEAEALRLAAAEVLLPFDLAAGPPLRVRVLRLGSLVHALLVTMHHIAADGWSTGILLREVTALAEAFGKGRASPLPELPIQYVDFAQWQRQALAGEALAGQLAYWRERLGGDLPPLELPSDRPRPPLPSHRGVQRTTVLPPESAEALRALSRREGATLFMVLLAAFQALLHRYGGQQDLAVGTPIAGRNRVEIEGLIGFFVNSLVVRVDLAGDPGFLALLARVREAAVGAFANADVPFERLVEELRPERDLSRTPLFQVMFSLQSGGAGGEPAGQPDLALAPMAIVGGTAMYDLTLACGEAGTFLAASLIGSTDLFDASTLVRMLEHLAALAAAVAAAPGLRLSELPLLSAAERHQVEREWNDTAGAGLAPVAPVHRLVAARAALAPAAVAVAQAGRVLTYGELDRRSALLARRLAALGAGPETVVAVWLERSPEMVVALLGALAAGAAYLPLDPAVPRERLAWVLEDAGAVALVTGGPLAAAAPPGPWPVLRLEPEDAAPPQQAPAEAPVPPDELGRLAYVIYTSGSTGVPKGVEIAHAGLANLVHWHLETYGVGARDRATQLAGLGFDAAVWEIWSCLAAGATLHLATEEVRLDPAALALWLREREITHCFVPTPLVEPLLAALPAGEGPLRWLLTGGDRLHRAAPGAGCRSGSSTTTGRPRPRWWRPLPRSTSGTPTGHRRSAGRSPAPRRISWTGELRPVPVGVPGELHIGGAGLARGYLRRAGPDRRALLPDPFGARPAPGSTAPATSPAGCRTAASSSWAAPTARSRSAASASSRARSRRRSRRHPAVREAVVLVRRPRVARVAGWDAARRLRGGGRRPRGDAERAGGGCRGARRLPPAAAARVHGARRLGAPRGAAAHRQRQGGPPGPGAARAPSGAARGLPPATSRRAPRPRQWSPSCSRRCSASSGWGSRTTSSRSAAIRCSPAGSLCACASASRRPCRSGRSSRPRPRPAWRARSRRSRRRSPARSPRPATRRPRRGSWCGCERRRAALPAAPPGRPALGGRRPALPRRAEGALSAELRSELAGRKTEILAFLHAARVGRRSAPPPLAPAPPGEPLPLSFAQERLWFLDRMEPGSAAYNVPLAARLAGPLDAAALARALAEIERRHQVLRTTFPAIEGRAVQVVGAPAGRPLPRVDLAGLPEHRRFPETLRLAAGAASCGLRSRDRAALRAALLRLGTRATDHALLLTLHHIVADGWSMGVLLRELATLYAAFAAGRPSPLPELPIQYADFALWQRRWLDGEVLAEQLAYWRRQLAGDLPPLDLPTDRPRPPVQSHRGALRPLALGASSAAAPPPGARGGGHALHGPARRLQGAAPPLSRAATTWSSARRSPGSAPPRLEPLIGFFVNTLVLRTDLSGDPSFSELLRRVREVALGAFSHQDLPFERLVEELQARARPVALAAVPGDARPGERRHGAGSGRVRRAGARAAADRQRRRPLRADARPCRGTGRRRARAARVQHRPLRGGDDRAPGRAPAGARGGNRGGDRRGPRPTALGPAAAHRGGAPPGPRRLERYRGPAARRRRYSRAHRATGRADPRRGGAHGRRHPPDLPRARAARGPARPAAGHPGGRAGEPGRGLPAALARPRGGPASACSRPAPPTCRSIRPTRPSGRAWCSRTRDRPPCWSTRPRPAGFRRRRRRGWRSISATSTLHRLEAAPRCRGSIRRRLAYVIYTSGSTGRPKGVMVEHRNVVNFFAGMDAALARRHETAGRLAGA